MFLFVCVCVFVCLVCLFVLLCISIILSEQVNDFAFSGIFEVEESHKELSICPRHRDDFGTRWLCNKKKKCSCPSDWAPHGKSSRKGDRGMTLQQSQKLYALTSTLVPVGSRGVSGVRSALLDTVVDETVGTQGKWKGISTLNNFSYTNNGESITVWRAYNVGKGKTLQWSEVPGENQYEIILNCTTTSYKLKIYMVLCNVKIYVRNISIQYFSV